MEMRMKTRTRIGMGVAALVIGAGAIVLAQPEGKGEAKADEVVIKLSEAPEAVRAAAAKIVPADKVTKVIKETDEGITTYEVEFTEGGLACSAAMSGTGDVMEIERGVKELPAQVMAALKKEFPKGTFDTPESVQKHYYEVMVTVDGKKHGVKVDAAGNIEDEGGKAKGKEEGEEDEEHEAKKEGKERKGDKD
jgi:hypothetical protein